MSSMVVDDDDNTCEWFNVQVDVAGYTMCEMEQLLFMPVVVVDDSNCESSE